MIKHLKQDLSFLTLYVRTMRRGLIPLFLLLFALQTGLMYYQVSTVTYEATVHPRTDDDYFQYDYEATTVVEGAPSFSTLMNRCHYPAILNGAFLILFALIAGTPLRNRNQAVRNYTLQRMGISHRRRYLLTAVGNLVLLLCLYFLENLTFFSSYLVYEAGIREEYRIFNGFFQSYVTNGFLRSLCPVTTPILFLYVIGLLGFYAIMLATVSFLSENQQYDLLLFIMTFLIGCILIISPEFVTDSSFRQGFLIFAVLVLFFNFLALHYDQYYKYEPKER